MYRGMERFLPLSRKIKKADVFVSLDFFSRRPRETVAVIFVPCAGDVGHLHRAVAALPEKLLHLEAREELTLGRAADVRHVYLRGSGEFDVRLLEAPQKTKTKKMRVVASPCFPSNY